MTASGCRWGTGLLTVWIIYTTRVLRKETGPWFQHEHGVLDDDVDLGVDPAGRFVLLAPTACAWYIVALASEGRPLCASL